MCHTFDSVAPAAPGLWKARHPSEVTRRVQLLCLDLGGSEPPGLGDSSSKGADNRNGLAGNLLSAQKPMGGQSDQSRSYLRNQPVTLKTPGPIEHCLGPRPGVSAAKRKLLASGEA